MIKETKIGTGQLFALLLTCRLLTTVIYSPFLDDGFFSGSWLLNILFTAVFLFVLTLPVLFIYKYYPSDNPVSLFGKSTALRKVLSVFYTAYFIYSAAFSFSRFDMFTTGIVFPEKDMSVLMVIAVFMCAYCAYLGLEALSRANVILLFLIAAGVTVILFSASKNFDYYNFEPFFFYPVSDSVKSGFVAASSTVETVMLLFLFRNTRGNFKKSYVVSFVALIMSTAVLFFFLYGVSGEFADTQLFPFYSLAVIAYFPFFERLDAVITAMFIFSLLIKCSTLIYISSELITDLTKRKNSIPGLFISAVSVSSLSILLSKNMTVHRSASADWLIISVYIISAVVIPSVGFALRKIKEKRI